MYIDNCIVESISIDDRYVQYGERHTKLERLDDIIRVNLKKVKNSKGLKTKSKVYASYIY